MKTHPVFTLKGGISVAAFATQMNATPTLSDEGPIGQVLASLNLDDGDVDRIEAVFVRDRLITTEVRLSARQIEPVSFLAFFGQTQAASEDRSHLVWADLESKVTTVAQEIGGRWLVTRRFYLPLLEMGLTDEHSVQRQLGLHRVDAR